MWLEFSIKTWQTLKCQKWKDSKIFSNSHFTSSQLLVYSTWQSSTLHSNEEKQTQKLRNTCLVNDCRVWISPGSAHVLQKSLKLHALPTVPKEPPATLSRCFISSWSVFCYFIPLSRMLHLGSYNLDWKAAKSTQWTHTTSLTLKLMSNNKISIWRYFEEQLILQSCNAWIFLLARIVSLRDQLMSFSSQLVISELNIHTQRM